VGRIEAQQPIIAMSKFRKVTPSDAYKLQPGLLTEYEMTSKQTVGHEASDNDNHAVNCEYIQHQTRYSVSQPSLTAARYIVWGEAHVEWLRSINKATKVKVE